MFMFQNMKLLSDDLLLRGQEFTFINSTESVNKVIREIAPELISKISLTEIDSTIQ